VLHKAVSKIQTVFGSAPVFPVGTITTVKSKPQQLDEVRFLSVLKFSYFFEYPVWLSAQDISAGLAAESHSHSHSVPSHFPQRQVPDPKLIAQSVNAAQRPRMLFFVCEKLIMKFILDADQNALKVTALSFQGG